MASASTSVDRINRRGKRGQPCLTPRLSLKKLLAHPLSKIQLSMFKLVDGRNYICILLAC